MAIPVELQGSNAQGILAKPEIYGPYQDGRIGRPGIVSYTSEYLNWRQRSILFVSEDGSRDMAVDASASGATENIHNGTDAAYWTATASIGTSWDFASTTQFFDGARSIECWDAANGDLAEIDRGSLFSTSSYEVITGSIYLERFNLTQDIIIYFEDATTLVGGEVSLNDYIDIATTGAWQQFQIPKADLGLNGSSVQKMFVRVDRPSGAAPRFYLDVLNFRATGSQTFTAEPLPGTYFEYNRVEFYLEDNIPLTVTGGTVTGLAPDQFMGLPELANGFTFQVTKANEADLALPFRSHRDFMGFTFGVSDPVSDGTNSAIKYVVDLPVYDRLDSRSKDKVAITINDDLSGLTRFWCILIGRELIPNKV